MGVPPLARSLSISLIIALMRSGKTNSFLILLIKKCVARVLAILVNIKSFILHMSLFYMNIQLCFANLEHLSISVLWILLFRILFL